MHQDCRELNLVHLLRVQTIDDTVEQSDGRYNNSGGFYMSSYLEKYFSSRYNNIGPVRFQLILLDTLFGRELSMFHIYLAVIFFILLCFILKENCLNFCKNINVRCNRHNDIITNLLQCLFVIFIYQ